MAPKHSMPFHSGGSHDSSEARRRPIGLSVGAQGQTIAALSNIQVSCALPGFRVADGDTWWYRISSKPWNNAYYVSADAFYNNGVTSGSLSGTPFVDPAVPRC